MQHVVDEMFFVLRFLFVLLFVKILLACSYVLILLLICYEESILVVIEIRLASDQIVHFMRFSQFLTKLEFY